MKTADIGAIWIIVPVVAPLAAAIVAFLAPRIAARIAFVSTGLSTFAGLLLLNAVSGRAVSHAVGGWGAPLGINLFADSLTSVMIVAASIVISAVTLYAPDYLQRTRPQAAFWPLVCFLHAALNGLFLSADIFNVYVALELLSLSAVGLVALGDEPAAIGAALRYLLASVVASLAYLLGVALLYHTYGALDLSTLSSAAGEGISTSAALGLMIAGLAVKAALFPLHFWLPMAHSEAPAPVGALLSGIVVQAPFYVLIRLWFGPFQMATQPVGQLLGLLGAVAILWGSLQALRQQRLKLLVAYSTVAQIGYLFLLFPLGGGDRTLTAITIFIFAHALAKAAMFLAAGNILLCLGHDRIEELDRIAGRLPLTLAAFGIGGVCIMGLPPSGNFIAKWLLIEAAFETGAWGWSLVIVAGSLLSAAYVFRVIGHAFTPLHEDEGGAPISQTMTWAPFVISLLALLLGMVAAPLLDLVNLPAPGIAATAGPVP